MVRVLVIAAAGALAWLVAPWVVMWRRGTLDQQTLRAIRAEARPPDD